MYVKLNTKQEKVLAKTIRLHKRITRRGIDEERAFELVFEKMDYMLDEMTKSLNKKERDSQPRMF